jgi:hypothetical protein
MIFMEECPGKSPSLVRKIRGTGICRTPCTEGFGILENSSFSGESKYNVFSSDGCNYVW